MIPNPIEETMQNIDKGNHHSLFGASQKKKQGGDAFNVLIGILSECLTYLRHALPFGMH